MKKKISFICMLLWVGISSKSFAQGPYVTFGPMVHFNFSNDGYHFSWGVESAYWQDASESSISHGILGADLGIEFERKKKIRLYSELEYGFAFYGIAGGAFWEHNSEKQKQTVGFQGSIWANMFGGIDMRFRESNEGFVPAPGIYFKVIPVGL